MKLCTFKAWSAVNPVTDDATQQQNETSACEAKDCSEPQLTTRQMDEVKTNSQVPHTISLQYTIRTYSQHTYNKPILYYFSTQSDNINEYQTVAK